MRARAPATATASGWSWLTTGENLFDARDHRVDRLLGADAVGHDTMYRGLPDGLLPDQGMALIARGSVVAVGERSRRDLHRRRHAVWIARMEPEWLVAKLEIVGRKRSPELE